VRAAVIGMGAVGRRVAQALASDPAYETVIVVHRDPQRVAAQVAGWTGPFDLRQGAPGDPVEADVTVVTAPSHVRRAVTAALEAGSHAVCAIDDPAEVKALLSLDEQARGMGLTVAVGTTMAPGLSCILAARLRSEFERVEEIHVASLGTGGPACARRHHAALTGVAVDWVDGEWRRRPGGSGRELVWFPEPVGGADCYRASLSDPLLLMPAFPECRRITSRLEATRRDRVTSWLPMLRQPHPEGLVGALRVEVRGWAGGRADTKILGASTPPAVVAAAVTVTTARWLAAGRLGGPGAGGLATLVPEPGAFLREVASAGVVVSAFQGAFTGSLG
jgi:saccharopine dehydrogenase-like NADP-dependent oxidoreductase